MGGGGVVPLQATRWMERSTVTSPQVTVGCTHHPEPPECAPRLRLGSRGQPGNTSLSHALEEVSECKAGGQEDLLQFNYLFKDSISSYSHIVRC